MKFVSFDIEIAKSLPYVGDWKAARPLGITCAATLLDDSLERYVMAGMQRTDTLLWFGRRDDGSYAPQMTKDEAQSLVRYLVGCQREGYVPLTWNGLGFDFDVLAEESGMFQECRELALNHIDMMFQFFCLRGFPVGLNAALHGMGLAGKPEGMDGSIAPQAWADGRYQECLDYVAGDVVQPLWLARIVQRRGYLTWVTKKGTTATINIERWLSVREAMELPEPDTSWMTDPWKREKFYGWTEV